MPKMYAMVNSHVLVHSFPLRYGSNMVGHSLPLNSGAHQCGSPSQVTRLHLKKGNLKKS